MKALTALASCLSLSLLAAAPAVAQSEITVEGTSLAGKPVLMVQVPAFDSLPTAVARSLEQRVSITWEGVPVAEAIDELNRLTGLPLVVAPEVRADPSFAVTLSLDNVTVRSLLEWVETQSGVSINPLHGGLYVSAQQPQAGTRTLVYDVSDLVISLPDFPAPELALGGGQEQEFDIFRDAGAGIGADENQRYSVEDLAEMVERMLNQGS